jgi:phospho-N-acetylmuramoyl-pentapeptide-transferase
MSSLPATVHIAVIPLAAAGVTVALGAPVIRLLRRSGAGQRVRNDGPQHHLSKQGTPTMGGLLILGAAFAAAILGDWWVNRRLDLGLIVLLAATAFFGCIGAADDWRKIRRGRSLGLRARYKLALQFLGAAGLVYGLGVAGGAEGGVSDGSWLPRAGWTAFWVLATVAASNAVNLADGLDGLVAGLCTIAAVGFAVLALLSDEPHVAVFALAIAGACAGFLVFNLHPAKLFMGDVGSLALGTAMAAMAAMLHQPLALLGLCLVPWVEELSVIAQVISFKTTGKRVLRMSPIHHHFELAGWSEERVVVTFWAVGAAAAAVVVGAALIG